MSGRWCVLVFISSAPTVHISSNQSIVKTTILFLQCIYIPTVKVEYSHMQIGVRIVGLTCNWDMCLMWFPHVLGSAWWVPWTSREKPYAQANLPACTDFKTIARSLNITQYEIFMQLYIKHDTMHCKKTKKSLRMTLYSTKYCYHQGVTTTGIQ